jgi:hypothetical protein
MRITLLVFLALGGISGCALSDTTKQGGEMRKITSDMLRFDESSSTAVISGAQKFIIPIPAYGVSGEPLIYPQSHERAGQRIVDYEGKTIGERGVVFFNAKDQSWQAVAGDGNGVIIVNEVTKEQADKIYGKIEQFHADPQKLSVDQLKKVLDYAREELGLRDMYNSTRSFIKLKMTPVSASEARRAVGQPIEAYGLMKRDDRDICQAVYIPGKFVFEGPAATPQVFEDGGVIVKQGSEMRGVQPEIFIRTYQFSDGKAIPSPRDVKTQGN